MKRQPELNCQHVPRHNGSRPNADRHLVDSHIADGQSAERTGDDSHFVEWTSNRTDLPSKDITSNM